MNRRQFVIALGAAVAGCGTKVTAVRTGEVIVKERLVVSVATPWNQFERGDYADLPTWTHEGITVDALQFWVALKDGDLVAPTPDEPKGQRPLAFRASMQPDDVVALYQGLWTRDGSTFTLDKLEPAPFLDGTGYRFEYSRLRKVDEVRLRGVAWFAVRNGQLYLINFSAPRLTFYDRYRQRAEAIARSAHVRG